MYIRIPRYTYIYFKNSKNFFPCSTFFTTKGSNRPFGYGELDDKSVECMKKYIDHFYGFRVVFLMTGFKSNFYIICHNKSTSSFDNWFLTHDSSHFNDNKG